MLKCTKMRLLYCTGASLMLCQAINRFCPIIKPPPHVLGGGLKAMTMSVCLSVTSRYCTSA